MEQQRLAQEQGRKTLEQWYLKRSRAANTTSSEPLIAGLGLDTRSSRLLVESLLVGDRRTFLRILIVTVNYGRMVTLSL